MRIFSLQGRTALITGAGQGVGRETALQMAAHGANGIVVNDYYLDRAEAVAEEVRAAGTAALAVQADVSKYQQVCEMVAKATTDLGTVDILVNNAGNAGPDGIIATPQFWETGPESWGPWLETNFHGVLNCSHAALPGMMEQRWGRILTVVSDAGRVGESQYAVYSGAKAGAAGFTRALAKAMGRYLVTCNCIALGAIMTPGLAARLEDPERRKKILSNYIIRRLGEPKDGAAALVYLASESASWVTGQTLPVNGGYSFAA